MNKILDLKLDINEAILMTEKNSKNYLLNFKYKDLIKYILILNNEMFLFIHYLNNDNYINKNIIFYNNYNDLLEKINNILKQYNIKKLKIEIDNIKYIEYEFILKYIKCQKINNIKNIFKFSRTIKSDLEIKKIILAQKINEKALNKTLLQLKLGISETELKQILIYNLYFYGAHGLAFDPIVSFGINTSYPHHNSNITSILEPGNLIMFDFGCVYDNYCSDMTRTFAYKYINNIQKKVYNDVLKIQCLIINYIKIGLKYSEIDAYSKKIFNIFGYKDFFDHSIGHSLGIDIHEYPYFTSCENYEISNGNIFTIEPGIYLKNKFGIRIEDMLLIKKNKIINITNQNKKLQIL